MKKFFIIGALLFTCISTRAMVPSDSDCDTMSVYADLKRDPK